MRRFNPFDKAAAHYQHHMRIQPYAAQKLIERLALWKNPIKTMLDLGTGPGYYLKDLKKQLKPSTLVATDLSSAMLQQAQSQFWRRRSLSCCTCDAQRLPFAENSFDCVISNLMLQWIPNKSALFHEVNRVLKPGGCFLFTSLGPDTLKELRDSFNAVDPAHQHVHQFHDMHHLGDLMLHNGFKDPIVDAEPVAIMYKNPLSLCHDLKGIGATYRATDRKKGFTRRKIFTDMSAYYLAHYARDEKIPATYELVFGHAIGGNSHPHNPYSVKLPLKNTC